MKKILDRNNYCFKFQLYKAVISGFLVTESIFENIKRDKFQKYDKKGLRGMSMFRSQIYHKQIKRTYEQP